MLISRKSTMLFFVFVGLIFSQSSLATDFTTEFSGKTFTITEADAPYSAEGFPGNKLGGIDLCQILLGDHVFETQPFITGGAGLHTIEIVSTNPSLDTFIALYSPSFDPVNPATNLVTCNDDIVPFLNQLSRLTPDLTTGLQYEVMVTTWDNNTQTRGSVDWVILPDIRLLNLDAPIPTTSQWALIMLSGLLGLVVFANRKRLF